MKLTRIEVKDYRSLFSAGDHSRFGLDLAEGMNALAGPNNCGKSNLLRALALALDSGSTYDKKMDIPAGMAALTVPRITLDFEITATSGPERTLLKRVAEYERSEVGDVKPTYADQGLIRFSKTFPAGDAPPRHSFVIRGVGARQGDPDLAEKAVAQFHKCIRFVLVRSGENVDELLAGKFREVLYAVLGERMAGALAKADALRTEYVNGLRAEVLGPLQDEIYRHAHDLFGEISAVQLDPDVRSIEETLANVGITLTDVIPSSLKDKGTGVRGAVLVAMLRYLADNSKRSMVFAIEEPEAFLHPGAQEELRDDLEGLAIRTDVTLLVTTHSPFIPSRDPEAQLVALQKDEDGRTHVVGQVPGDEPHAATLSGLFRDSVFTDLLARAERVPEWARGVLFVEGTTDEEYLRIAARKAGRNDLLTGLHIVPTGGASKAVLEVVLVRQHRDLPMVVLLDNDTPGIETAKQLKRFGLKPQEILTYGEILKKGVTGVEAEDLIAEQVLSDFADRHGREAVVTEWVHVKALNRYHYGFNAVGKDHLPEYLQKNANADDMRGFVDVLETVRNRLDLLIDDTFVPLDKSTARAIADVWTLPDWCDDEADLQRAMWLLGDLTPAMTEVVASFARHADGADGDVIGAEAGYATGARGIPAALGSIAMRCKQVERKPMWCLNYGSANETAGTYTMPETTLNVFGKALEQVRPAWRDLGAAS